jgi:3-dehydroquinate synthase
MKSIRGWTYEVEVRQDVASAAAPLLRLAAARRCLLVTTPAVRSLYRRMFENLVEQGRGRVGVHVAEGGEAGKTLGAAWAICRRAAEEGMERGDVLVGIGGGVCTDLTVVAASLVRRGVGAVKVPTTLIGQIDAGIGIKGGVNEGGAKNYLGCFHPPEAVWVDPTFLQTLPAEHLRYGLAEAIKIALVGCRQLFGAMAEWGPALVESGFAHPAEIARQVIARSIELMLDELRPNLFENRDNRRAVDLGHTFSPLLEETTNFALHHGAAVAIDLALSAGIAAELGCCSQAERDAIHEILSASGLPLHHPSLTPELCRKAMEKAAAHRRGAMNLVVPAGIGKVAFIEQAASVPETLLAGAIAGLSRRQARSDGLRVLR